MSAPEPMATAPGGGAAPGMPVPRGGRGWLIAAAVVNGLLVASLLSMAGGVFASDNPDATAVWWVSLFASVLAPFYAWNLWRRGRSGAFVQIVAWSPVVTWALAAVAG